jgi:putative phage-type endonuclease
MDQNTPEWYAARLGKLTASKAAVIMGDLKTSGLATYVKAVAWERVFGARDEEYRNACMDRGHEFEPLARAWYEFERDVEVETVGIVPHPSIEFIAASPDGLLPDRTLEIKSVLHGAWMEVKRTQQVPSEYRWQCRWQMMCAGLSLCDFVCYHPVARGIIVPFEQDDNAVALMEERAGVVNEMVEKWVAIIREREDVTCAP